MDDESRTQYEPHQLKESGYPRVSLFILMRTQAPRDINIQSNKNQKYGRQGNEAER